MDKGAALFDGVAISGTEAAVRAGGQRWVLGPMCVGGGGGGLGRRRRRVRLGCEQIGGVVSMGYGEVTFKGGTITNITSTVRDAGRMRVLDAACCEDYAARCAARAAWGCGARWFVRAVRCLLRVACRTWVVGTGLWALGGTFTVGAHSAASHGIVLCCGRHAAWRIGLWPGLGPERLLEGRFRS
jgi:hypothetical protein